MSCASRLRTGKHRLISGIRHAPCGPMDSRWHDAPVIAQIARPTGGAAKFPRVLILALAAFSALSCIAGGIEIFFLHRGDRRLPLPDVRHFTPFYAYVMAGLILAVVVGGAQTGILVTQMGVSAAVEVVALGIAGALEGLLLGAGAGLGMAAARAQAALCAADITRRSASLGVRDVAGAVRVSRHRSRSNHDRVRRSDRAAGVELDWFRSVV